jgi:hypothetical protein
MKEYEFNAQIADFGKIVFAPKNHTMPWLPDMNLIVLKNDEGYQAVCIDIEVDAVGKTLKDACNNLRKTLITYVGMMIDNYEGDIKAAVKDIVEMAYSQGEQKKWFFDLYLQAKHQYMIEKISKENRARSRMEDIANAFKRAFQIQPIHFNLTMAAGVA